MTMLWLLEHCGCDHIRMNIGKKKLSVIKLKQFEKEQIKIKERKFKEGGCVLKTIVLGPPGTGKTHHSIK